MGKLERTSFIQKKQINKKKNESKIKISNPVENLNFAIPDGFPTLSMDTWHLNTIINQLIALKLQILEQWKKQADSLS